MTSTGKDCRPNWDRAFQILHALEANNNRSGSLVRRTSGIDSWQHHLVQPSIDRENRCLGPVVSTWYCQVMKACPRLEQITLSFSTEEELHKILRSLALVPPGSTIAEPSQHRPRMDFCAKSITFAPGLSSQGVATRITYAQVLDALQRTSIQNLDTIEFDRVDRIGWMLTNQYLSSTTQNFPFSTRSLDITKVPDQDSWYAQYFPRFASTLEQFRFSLYSSSKSDVDTSFPEITAPNLKALCMSFAAAQCLSLSSYISSNIDPSIVVSRFASFPRLTSISLCGTHGPSLLLLETLAKSSPLLSSIDFHSSRWISTADPLSTVSNELFPEIRIFVTLQTMQQLRKVDLGILPTVDPERYEGMKAMLELRGIEMKYKRCYGA
ncbi:hypothetical protein JCM5353_008888 [Sporobolomyces roseus]